MLTDAFRFEIKEVGTNNTVMYIEPILGLSILSGEIYSI